MTEFKTEGDPAFPVTNEGNVTPPESSSGETTVTEQTPSSEGDQTQTPKKDGGDAGFADHPRWKQRETDWSKRFNDQEQRHVQEIAQIRKDLESRFKPQPREQGTPMQIPSWFGGTEEQWSEFTEWNKGLVSQAEEGVRQKMYAQAQAEQQRIEEATSFMESQVASIEVDQDLNPDGVKVDRNKLLKFVQDNDLVDSQGRWNYKAGFRLMQAQANKGKTEALKERQKLASITTSESRAEQKSPSYMTSSDFEKPGARPW